MARYSVRIKTAVAKDLQPIPRKQVKKILAAIQSLAEEPRPPQSKKLSGDEKYRLRCGVYRILYEICDEELHVYVVRARHRKDVYR